MKDNLSNLVRWHHIKCLQLFVFQTNVNLFELVSFEVIEQTLDEIHKLLSQKVSTFQKHHDFLIRYNPKDLFSPISLSIYHSASYSHCKIQNLLHLQPKKPWIWFMIHLLATNLTSNTEHLTHCNYLITKISINILPMRFRFT